MCSTIHAQKEMEWNATNNVPVNTVPPDLMKALQHHSLFQQTQPEFVQKLACCMHLRTYSPHDIIIVEGETSKAMFFLLRGEVDVCSADFERVYATLSKGSCFGEIGILYSMPRTATVIARTKCSVAVLTADNVLTLLPQFPNVERTLRFEAEERLARLQKYKKDTTQTLHRKPSVDSHVDAFDQTCARELLRKCPLFHQCPDVFLHQISLNMELRHYDANAQIVRPQKHDHRGLYFIVRGTVEISARDDNGQMCHFLRRSGEYFGCVAALLHSEAFVSVRSVTPIELFEVRGEDFWTVYQQHPDLHEQMHTQAQVVMLEIKEKMKMGRLDRKEGQDERNDQSSPIAPQAVCSTTSDQDPTLPPATQRLKMSESGPRRRLSVAVWSDPHLLSLAEKFNKREQESVPSSLSTTSVQKPQGQRRDRLTTLQRRLFEHIASFLEIRSLIRLSAVSRASRALVMEGETLFRQVDLSPYHKRITDAQLAALAGVFRGRVESLCLSHCFHVSDAGLQMLATLPRITTLDLSSCWLITDQSLALVGEACPRLVSVDLSNCRKITRAGIQALAKPGKLADLSVSYCKNLDNDMMATLAHDLSDSLVSLNLQRCTRITDDGFAAWEGTVFSRLTHINLTDCSFLTNTAVRHLVAAAPQLQSLSLSFCCALSDRAILTIATLPSLMHLDLSFCGAAVSDPAIHTLLTQQSTLTLLNLRGCVRLTSQGLRSLLDHRRLHTLNLTQCPGVLPEDKSALVSTSHVDMLIA